MQNPEFDRLRYQLETLVREEGLVALKTGTEVEDMGFEDIYILRQLSQDIIPLYVKIGGPEARNDMRELVRLGVDGLIAPMIESVYALHKFIITLKEVLSPLSYQNLTRGINLETIDGFSHMNSILASDDARELHQITAARTDLSGSMGLGPDDERVLEICSMIVARARENELKTSVGGGIMPGSAENLIHSVTSDTINTRHMVMSCEQLRAQPFVGVEKNLRFEVELYQYLSKRPSPRQDIFKERAQIILDRINQSRKPDGRTENINNHWVK